MFLTDAEIARRLGLARADADARHAEDPYYDPAYCCPIVALWEQLTGMVSGRKYWARREGVHYIITRTYYRYEMILRRAVAAP